MIKMEIKRRMVKTVRTALLQNLNKNIQPPIYQFEMNMSKTLIEEATAGQHLRRNTSDEQINAQSAHEMSNAGPPLNSKYK
jgi:hypothetical protein